MPELRLVAPPARRELLACIGERLGDVVPGGRVVARDLLGAEEPIDFVAVEPGGRVTLVLVAGEDEELEAIARAVAQRAFVAPRLRDWIQLAPELGVRPEAGVRALLLCLTTRPEALAAARALGPGVVVLARYRCVRNGAGIEALLEVDLPDDEEPTSGPVRAPLRASGSAPEPPRASFRTGLTDADLGSLSDAEVREFE